MAATVLAAFPVCAEMCDGRAQKQFHLGISPAQQCLSVNLTAVLRRCRDGLIAVGLFSMGINLLVLTVSIYMLQVYDRVLPGRSVETLIYLTIIATGALATMGALDLLRSRILVRLGIWIDRTLSPALFGRGWRTCCAACPTALRRCVT